MEKGILDLEGPVFSAMDKIGQLVLLSVVWIIGCLPVVTIATSTTALYYAVCKSIRHDCGAALKEFFGSYKANLKRGIPVTVAVAGLAALLEWNIGLLTGAENGSHFLLWGSVILLAVLAGSSIYICPVLSRFQMGAWKACRLAFVMAVRFLPYTVLIAATAVTVGYLQYYVLPMPALVLLPSVMCYGATYPVEKALRKFMPPKEENDDSWYYQ